jgi:hypothetical protein
MEMIITSNITGKTYDPAEAIYITNPVQCSKYFNYLGDELFLDILYTSKKGESCLTFVWKKCLATREAKIKWDNHQL